MRFQMRGINHQHIIGITGSGKRGEYLVEHTHTAPANEAVIDRLVWPVSCRCIAPAQAVADNEDNAADNATIGDAGNALGNWEEGLDPLHLGGREQENISHGGTSAMG